MRFFVYSPGAELHGIARRLLEESHEVRFYRHPAGLADVPLSDSKTLDARLSDVAVLGAPFPGASRVLRAWVGGASDPPPWAHRLQGPLGSVTPTLCGWQLNRVLAGDLGPRAPEVATLLAPWWEDTVVASQMRGDWRGHASPGFLAALAELLDAPLGETLAGVAVGRLDTLPLREGEVAISVRVSIPPSAQFMRPVEVAPGARKHFWPADMSVDFGQAGPSGVLGWASARGRTPREAGRRVMKVLSGIKADDLQYRVDAASALEALYKQGEEDGSTAT